MTDTEILQRVKTALGISGEYQDDTIKIFIQDVRNYMLDAGVPESIVDSDAAIGTFVRGVADLWNYGSGSAELSPYFKERVIQMASNATVEPTPTPTVDYLPLTGGTMQGDVDMGGHNLKNLATQHPNDGGKTNYAATIGYVNMTAEMLLQILLPFTGGTMTGDINMGLNKVTNIGNPTDDNDAATKAYVDESVSAIPAPASPTNDIRVVDFVTAGITTMGLQTKIETGAKRESVAGTKYKVYWYIDIFPEASDIAENFSYSTNATYTDDDGVSYPMGIFFVEDKGFILNKEILVNYQLIDPSVAENTYRYVNLDEISELLKGMIEEMSPSSVEEYGVSIENFSPEQTTGKPGVRFRISLYFQGFQNDGTTSAQVLEVLNAFAASSISWRLTYKNSKNAGIVNPIDGFVFTRL